MYVILEWSSGKKTQNEEQDADTPEPSSHPLEGFSCSKEELEQKLNRRILRILLSLKPLTPLPAPLSQRLSAEGRQCQKQS